MPHLQGSLKRSVETRPTRRSGSKVSHIAAGPSPSIGTGRAIGYDSHAMINTDAEASEYPLPSRIKSPERLKAGRAKIVRVALELFSQQGFNNTSIEEVAAGSGYTVGAIYKYVRSKHDLLFLTAEYLTERASEVALAPVDGSSPEIRLKSAISTYFRHVDLYHRAVRISYRESQNLEPAARRYLLNFYTRLRDWLVRYLRPVAEENGPCDDRLLWLIAQNLIQLAHMWAVNHFLYSQYLTLDEVIDAQMALALRQLTPSSAREFSMGQQPDPTRQ